MVTPLGQKPTFKTCVYEWVRENCNPSLPENSGPNATKPFLLIWLLVQGLLVNKLGTVSALVLCLVSFLDLN